MSSFTRGNTGVDVESKTTGHSVPAKAEVQGDIPGPVVSGWRPRWMKNGKRPVGLKWRSSTWFITLVVAGGITVDILTYTIVVPVLPYRLQELEYTNVSALTAWLLFAYSIGIFLFTLPVAYFFHLHKWRRGPLVAATLLMIGSLIMFMLATPFWLMILARFIQGGSSCVIWTVGFALICENVPEKHIGRQLGYAIAGTSIGATIAPPIGGALYFGLGWHAPFLFCIIACFIDLIGRLLVIEQKDIVVWNDLAERQRAASHPNPQAAALPINPQLPSPSLTNHTSAVTDEAFPAQLSQQSEKPKPKELSPFGVLRALISSPRGCTALALTSAFSLVIGCLDSTLTLRVETIWEKNSAFVGLVYLAAAAPTFVAGPICGHIADLYGGEVLALPALVFALPFIPLMILKASLPGFIVIFALANLALAVMMSPVGLELAMVSKSMEGISEIHQFAAMNIAFSISTAIGSVVGGQLYDGLPKNGWEAVCWFCFACCTVATIPAFMYAGERPILARIKGRKGISAGELEPENDPQTGGAVTGVQESPA